MITRHAITSFMLGCFLQINISRSNLLGDTNKASEFIPENSIRELQVVTDCRCEAYFEDFYTRRRRLQDNINDYPYDYTDAYQDTDGYFVVEGVKVLDCENITATSTSSIFRDVSLGRDATVGAERGSTRTRPANIFTRGTRERKLQEHEEQLLGTTQEADISSVLTVQKEGEMDFPATENANERDLEYYMETSNGGKGGKGGDGYSGKGGSSKGGKGGDYGGKGGDYGGKGGDYGGKGGSSKGSTGYYYGGKGVDGYYTEKVVSHNYYGGKGIYYGGKGGSYEYYNGKGDSKGGKGGSKGGKGGSKGGKGGSKSGKGGSKSGKGGSYYSNDMYYVGGKGGIYYGKGKGTMPILPIKPPVKTPAKMPVPKYKTMSPSPSAVVDDDLFVLPDIFQCPVSLNSRSSTQKRNCDFIVRNEKVVPVCSKT